MRERLHDNLAQVRERMRRAAARAGRQVDGVRLVAVTKYAPVAALPWLRELGELDWGENRPQQLLERAALFPAPIRWHMIGTLQRNKVRKLLPAVTLVHAVDSERLVQEIERAAVLDGLAPRVLCEVNISGEASKHGFTPDGLRAAWPELSRLRATRVAGLMTMAPFADDPEAARPVFRALRQLRDELNAVAAEAPSTTDAPPAVLTELSMGMTGDFEVAIEEGATLIRIGSALWDGVGSESST